VTIEHQQRYVKLINIIMTTCIDQDNIFYLLWIQVMSVILVIIRFYVQIIQKYGMRQIGEIIQ